MMEVRGKRGKRRGEKTQDSHNITIIQHKGTTLSLRWVESGTANTHTVVEKRETGLRKVFGEEGEGNSSQT